jgi:DNA-binding MarR family transcriptional regulator
LSELSVLSRVDRCGTLAAGVLAEQERVSPQAMSAILAAVEQRGYVARSVDAADARRLADRL